MKKCDFWVDAVLKWCYICGKGREERMKLVKLGRFGAAGRVDGLYMGIYDKLQLVVDEEPPGSLHPSLVIDLEGVPTRMPMWGSAGIILGSRLYVFSQEGRNVESENGSSSGR